MKPPWAEYEALARQIVSELAPHATVTHNDSILGAESETKRQIDVSIRWNDGQTENLMIVQVRDRTRKADVNTVGEFRSVVQDVGAQKGVLICSSGFSKNAITYARNIGLLLWSLADARSTKWAAELTVPVLRTKLTPFVQFDGTFQARHNGSGIEVREVDGSAFNLIESFTSAWVSGSLSFEPKRVHQFVIEKPLFVHILHTEDGSPAYSPIGANITYTVQSQSHLAHLSPSDYRGIQDHLDGRQFIPSRLDLSIPSLNDSVWLPISDPGRIALNLRGTFFMLQDARLDGDWTAELTVMSISEGPE